MEFKLKKLILGFLVSALLPAPSSICLAASATLIPPEVQNQAQTIEGRFNSVINEECATHLCTPVGCEVLSFKTLDEKQNSSLPGLDVEDETQSEVRGDIQYKLSSLRCEFAFESVLSAEAVSSLRQRVSDKVRAAGVSLSIQGRKLPAASPLLKDEKKGSPQPLPTDSKPWADAIAKALPTVLIALALTLGLLSLIWGFRRLGKPKPPPTPESVLNSAASSEAEDSSVHSAFALVNKKERLTEAFAANPQMAAAALEPIVAKRDVKEICRVLEQFGPAPLAYFAQKSEYRDLFVAVHEQYEKKLEAQTDGELAAFYDKLERLLALAQLGRPEADLQDDLAFVKDLAPDEFSELVENLSEDELMAVLSFVPPSLRAHYLQSRDAHFAHAYAKHLMSFPRLSEQLLRRLARQMREHYEARHAEIKKIGRDQLTQLEQLLNALGGPQRNQLFANLRKENPLVFEKLISEFPLDRAVVNVPEDLLNEIFLTLTPEEGAAYLKAHPDRQAVLAKLKIPLARVINDHMGPVLKRVGSDLGFKEDESPAALSARERVTEILKTKSAQGQVNLRRINESVLGSL